MDSIRKLVSKRFCIPYVKLKTTSRYNGVLDKEEATFSTLNTSNDFGKEVRDVFLRSLGKGQPIANRKRYKETPKNINGWFTSICSAHDDESSEFSTTKRVKSRDMNMKMLENTRHHKSIT
ncbi:hypothetical protein Tco_1471318, partial [Tanacetum coccineum]